MTTQTTLALPPEEQSQPRPDTAGTPVPSLGLPRRSTALGVLFALWAAIFFASLFAPPLLDDADATHANAARHILTSGDWVTLYVNGIRYLEKAPLPYWIVAASFKLFGFNAFAAHLPQAVAVLLLALLGYYWAAKAFNARTGLYTGVMVLTSAGVFLFTRVFIPEVWLSLFLAIALYTFLQSVSMDAVILSGAKNPRILSLLPYLMWTSLALAVLTKGLVAPVFLFGTAVVYLALTGEYRHWRRLKPFTGAILLLAIAAPWHILAGLRNTDGTLNGHPHGFFWFYFVNEHFLRFLGKRYPVDYNKLPGYLFWSLHLVWLFPWALFGPNLASQSYSALKDGEPRNRRTPRRQTQGLLAKLDSWGLFNRIPRSRKDLFVALGLLPFIALAIWGGASTLTFLVAMLCYALIPTVWQETRSLRSERVGTLTDSQQTTLLLSLYSALVLLFFSFSTNQEYYTFPAYLPLLMLLAAALTRAESTYAASTPEAKSSRRWILFAHAALTVIGIAAATALFLGLWTSRHLPFVPDIGDLLAHRGVGDYTLSMSHLFDLTGPSFAALRLPAILAALAFAFGPAIAWFLRGQRRHLAATGAIAVTSATFLIAAHIALVRFGPMLSSETLAATIIELRADRAIAPDTKVMLYGDQSYGSSIPFYLGQQVSLVEGVSSSMIFGSSFPDAPKIFLTNADLVAGWGTGPRKLLFVPLERRDDLDRVLPVTRQLVLAETSGKALITDRPLEPR